MKKTRVFLALLLLSAASTGNGRENAPGKTLDPIPAIISQVAESTYASHLLGLQAFGTRIASASNHDSVASWIAARFSSFGITNVAFDSFTVGGTVQRNVVATIPGSDVNAGEVIIGAHYDSQSPSLAQAPGADDNASGTAAVLEMARVLQKVGYHPKLTIRFATFASEELGLLGSAHYAGVLQQNASKIIQMQNYDMIAYLAPGDAARYIRIIWYEGARTLAEADSAIMRTYTSLTPVLSTSYRSQSDSWSFTQRGYKAFFNIENTLTPFYHTTRDSTTVLSMPYAVEVTRSGLALLIDTDTRVLSSTALADRMPDGFRLEQNYPNPFNPNTNIGYRVWGLGSKWVRLAVYDLLGRELALLVNEEKEPGNYTVRFDASSLSSGVYVYRLSVGDFTDAKKMALLR
jgi:Zn-dependent M28 family amino/carboxypeptidase